MAGAPLALANPQTFPGGGGFKGGLPGGSWREFFPTTLAHLAHGCLADPGEAFSWLYLLDDCSLHQPRGHSAPDDLGPSFQPPPEDMWHVRC